LTGDELRVSSSCGGELLGTLVSSWERHAVVARPPAQVPHGSQHLGSCNSTGERVAGVSPRFVVLCPGPGPSSGLALADSFLYPHFVEGLVTFRGLCLPAACDEPARLAAYVAPSFTVLRRSQFHRFLKRRALTEEKRRPFSGPATTCFWTPLPRKDKLLRASLARGNLKTL
jgi:hypothetical protein